MDKNEVLQMARECGLGMMLQDETTHGAMWEEELEHFAHLVEQRTREECARICDDLAEMNRDSPTDSMWQWGECAAAIRATSTLHASKVEGR